MKAQSKTSKCVYISYYHGPPSTRASISMSSWQRQQDELSALTSIFRADELTICDEGGVFHANVRTPTSLVVTGIDGTRDALKYLPPLSLHFTLPPGYPDEAPPSFMLAGHWLSFGQLSRLCKRLDELYEPGQEALFTWFSFLQDETWPFLHLPETLSIVALQRQRMRAKGIRRDIQSQHKAGSDGTRNEVPPLGQQTESQTEVWKVALSAPVSDLDCFDKDRLVSCEANPKETVTAGRDDCGDSKGSEDPEDCEDRDDTEDLQDSRAMVEVVQSLRDLLIAHANAQARADFERNAQECAVCLMSHPGSLSVLFSPCGHVVCCDCATRYLRQATLRASAVTCPGSECSAPFPHHLARELLSEEEFLSYDSRLLESALSSLADIVRCPRPSCQYAVTRDLADGKLATCFNCRYAFCVDCRQGYHGVEPCRFRPDEQQKLISEYREGSATERAVLEKRYGKRRLEGLVESDLTRTWLADFSKRCPHCQAGIEKSMGCNKMVCWRCNTHFCWLCSTRLDPLLPYAHFLSPKSPCHRLLFQGMDPNEDEDDEDPHIENLVYIEDVDQLDFDM